MDHPLNFSLYLAQYFRWVWTQPRIAQVDFGIPFSWIIATLVHICTCILEVMQLWHPPFLEFLKSFFIGRTILGNTFAWSGFPYYFIGIGSGLYVMVRLQKN